ncbi:DUF3344 domain-containing protein [uncultured Methanobacterium sp.]|uniref:DUF3344 domain-containing protein n=1 Tax=uncultured Methanobacterium sp. TaxID=176306 RepID=UPI002AA8113A|nr:DUF3344 domain-containing protein [uncultured Methanobacterium sp.]
MIMKFFKKNHKWGEGKNSQKAVKTVSLLILALVFTLVLSGAVSAENVPLNTTHNGTVSGDLYVNATQPVPFADQPSGATSREFNQTYNLPTNSSQNGTDIQWAEIYVNIYSGSGSNNWPVNATIMLDGNGDGVYETTLGNELLTSTNYSTDGTIYWINDHCFRVYSDYQLWYDVTGLINCTNPSIYVKTEQVGTDTFDGRLKMITLIAAYNDGDQDKVHYWVNDGQDWINTGETSQTTFNTSTVNANIANATLQTVALSSKDGSYNFNGETHNGTDPVAPINYFVTHSWDVTANVTRENSSTLSFTAASGSLKNVLATLTIREKYTEPPVANFTINNTSGYEPLTIHFTDNSTGIISSWAWDFNNDGVTDSNVQNPTYTFTIPGTYTVKLTLTGPGGTVSETKTNYIAVIPHNYSTYLGGTGTENGQGIAVDSAGNIYIVGYTESADFPTTPGAYQNSNAGGRDAFLAKFNSSGNLIYSTYLGGTGIDYGYGIAVDNIGNAYITGYTNGNFPITSDSHQITYGGGSYDAFLAKFNSNGTLIYSTYLGGTGTDYGYGIAADNNGNCYITGSTGSTNFPTTSGAYQITKASSGTGNDAFVSKFNSSGVLVYSTYLGGTSTDTGRGITVDNSGNAHITGTTSSTNFPTTTGAYQSSRAGSSGSDVFVTKLNPNGNGLVYSTYLGGTSSDQGYSIVADNAGNAYVTGTTSSTNFPTTTGTYQPSFGGGSNDVFVTKLNPTGTDLLYSTYLGGTGSGYGYGIAVDNSGNAYITGYTDSIPTTTGAYQTRFMGGFQDPFISKLNTNGTVLVYSTYYGTLGIEQGNSIAVDNQGNAYITGQTGTYIFPTTPGAYQTTPGGYEPSTGASQDGFMVKLDIRSPVADFTCDRVCDYVPLTVHFTDQSTNGVPTTWAWDFNNDGIIDSTEQNPTWTYNTTGFYTVKLTVSNLGGSNSITKTDYITVNALPDDHEAPNVTVTPSSGIYTSAFQVTLSATDNLDTDPKIYYTINGEDPTTASTQYTGPITINENTTLKFIGADKFANIGTVQTETYIINDTEAPVVTANHVSGTYNINTTVTLSATDNADPNPLIYYTTNGEDPTTASTLYTGPITLPNFAVTTLKFIAVDKNGIISPVQTETYNITDIEAPTVIATQDVNKVILTATDNSDPNPTIYYTTDGTDPKTNSTPYKDPFSIPGATTTVVKFIAVDLSGNPSPVQSRTFNTTRSTDILTGYYAEGNVGVSVVQYGNYGWFAYNEPGTGTATFTASSLNIPEGATILSARLYQAWTWRGYPGYTLQFNGITLPTTTHYVDGNDGQDFYDVTACFNQNNDNIAVLTATGGCSYGTILIVVYNSSSEPYQKIWVNEGFDILYANSGYGSNHGPGHVYFNNVNNTNVSSAQLTAILPSGQGDGNTITFNGQNLSTTGRTDTTDPACAYFNILTALQNGTNEIEYPEGPYYSIQNAILTLTMYTAPVTNFTANTIKGTDPLTVQFTDTTTNNPTTWAWDFDNDGIIDSTLQNPTWTYTSEGIYNVTLTARNSAGNNTLTRSNLIKVGKPDLSIADVQLPNNPVVGGIYNITATIVNNGLSDAGAFNVKLAGIGTQRINNLTAGASTVLSWIWTPTTTGSFQFDINSDRNNEIAESNEANNIYQQNLTVSDPRADIIISNVQGIPANPIAGQTYTITTTITNKGQTDATGFNVKFAGIGTQRINSLTAGATTTLTWTWTPTTVGDYTFSINSDRNNEMTESNENNNIYTQTVNVTDNRPDITITHVTGIPANPVAGQSYTITVTVANTGNGDASGFNVKFAGNGTQRINNLAAGATTTLTWTWTPTATGDYNLNINTDRNNEITEANKTNNIFQQTVYVG